MVQHSALASKSPTLSSPVNVVIEERNGPLSFQGRQVLAIPHRATARFGFRVEAEGTPVPFNTPTIPEPIGKPMMDDFGRELQEKAGIARQLTRPTNLPKQEQFLLYVYRQLNLAREMGLYWYWFTTINLRQSEVHTDAINALRDNLPSNFLWTGINVPETKKHHRHLHLILALPNLSADGLFAFEQRRNRKLDRSVHSLLVYDLGGLFKYFVGPPNLGRKYASPIACRQVKQSKGKLTLGQFH